MAEQRESTTPLSDLVGERRAKLGLSFRALALRCVDPETGEQLVKSSWLERLEKRQPVITPLLPQLRALAAGLEVPVRRLQDEAAAQFLGMARPAEWSADSSVRAVVADMEDLDEAGRRELAELVEFYARKLKASRERDDS